MREVHTNSPEETESFGERLSSQLRSGDVILLLGDLGVGKSQLTRGVARGLGVQEIVTSPTFTILNLYESGRLPLYHFDWYRLQDAEELYEMGLDEYLGGDGVAMIEWPMQCPDAIPADCLLVRLTPEGETGRCITWQSWGDFREISLEVPEAESRRASKQPLVPHPEAIHIFESGV